MPVPEFYHFIRPALDAHLGGDVRDLTSVRREVILKLKLTPEDEEELVASGNTTKAYDQTQWALTYLRAARLLEQPKRGWNRITDRGREFLRTAPEIIKPDLFHVFEEFREFQKPKGRSKAMPNASDAVEIEAPLAKTPEETLETSFGTLQRQLAEDVLDRVKGMSPAFFERLIVSLMLRLGYGGPSGEGRVLGRTGDGGVDGVINQDKLGLEKIYLQAKKYTSGSVGSPEVQGFAGALMGHGARKGVFITTSTFSSAAKAYVAGLKDYKISLIDGIELASLMIDHDLGVALARRYDVKRIDSDFFTEATT